MRDSKLNPKLKQLTGNHIKGKRKKNEDFRNPKLKLINPTVMGSQEKDFWKNPDHKKARKQKTLALKSQNSHVDGH